MTQPTAEQFLSLVDARRGHFRLESGHHGGLWLDLDPLFSQPRRIEPFVEALATAIEPHDVDVVCGPLLGGALLAAGIARAIDAEFWFTERVTPLGDAGMYRVRYRLPRALATRASGRRVAIVDDVMSAGSSLRATALELDAHGALTVVAGALLVLGTAGESYFADRGVAVQGVAREEYQLWTPDACPLCAAGAPLEAVTHS
jgi:orotate phosphoribosyltransferase